MRHKGLVHTEYEVRAIIRLVKRGRTQTNKRQIEFQPDLNSFDRFDVFKSLVFFLQTVLALQPHTLVINQRVAEVYADINVCGSLVFVK